MSEKCCGVSGYGAYTHVIPRGFRGKIEAARTVLETPFDPGLTANVKESGCDQS